MAWWILLLSKMSRCQEVLVKIYKNGPVQKGTAVEMDCQVQGAGGRLKPFETWGVFWCLNWNFYGDENLVRKTLRWGSGPPPPNFQKHPWKIHGFFHPTDMEVDGSDAFPFKKGWLLPALKLTARPWKWMVGIRISFPLGFRRLFSGCVCLYVGFREVGRDFPEVTPSPAFPPESTSPTVGQ